MTWCAGFEEICRPQVPLCEHTWYRLGGPAAWLATPRDEAELGAVLNRCAGAGLPWRVLGRGSNVLVRDEGFDGVVIRLAGPFWEQVEFADPHVQAGAGADLPKLIKQTLEHGLVGLENLAGIPGTVGGAIRMNAGGRYGNIATHLRHVRLMRPDGTSEVRPPGELGFGYRTSQLEGAIVLGATFALAPGDSTAARTRHEQIWREKYRTQPPLSARSAGCIFKNPAGHAAGALLDKAGLKGTRSGDAEISTQHANFIVAGPHATARDVLDLIHRAQERVRQSAGVELDLEIEVW